MKPQSPKFVPLLADLLILENWILGNPYTRECRSLPLKGLVSVMTRSRLIEVFLYVLRAAFALSKKAVEEAGKNCVMRF